MIINTLSHHERQSSIAGLFELVESERGKTWIVKQAFTVIDEHGRKLTVRSSYEHDRYTLAPDLPDTIPSISHDFLYDIFGAYRKWDNGDPVSRIQADRLIRHLMLMSHDPTTRNLAETYFKGVRHGGWLSWYKGSVRLFFHNMVNSITNPSGRDEPWKI